MARLAAAAALALLISTDARLNGASCPPANFSTVDGFNLTSFVSTRWYIQQQMATSYLPKTENRCVFAEYSLPEKKPFWGYEIRVRNYAEDVASPYTVHDSGPDLLCAKIEDSSAGKLKVAPCFLPPLLAGPYWVLDYNEEEGYALISGGAPTISAPGGCRTGTGVNDSGLWIFTREQMRNAALVSKVRDIAAAKGFDLSVLNDVIQTGCNQTAPTSELVV